MRTAQCTRCGAEFTTPNPRKILCRKDCGRTTITKNAARTKRRAVQSLKHSDCLAPTRFIAVDGEGVDRVNGRHEYVMLSVGDRTLTNPDGSRLHHDTIFGFLMDAYDANPHDAFIGFALGYDFTMWTSTFAEHEARMLFSPRGVAVRKSRSRKNPEPFPVYVDGLEGRIWEVDILAGRRFRIARHIHEPDILGDAYDNCRYCGRELPYPDIDDAPPTLEEYGPRDLIKPKRRPSRRLYICDTFPFWQSSFLAAIDPAGWAHPIIDSATYELIAEGKGKRDSYTIKDGDTSFIEEMSRYNRAENRALATLTETLDDGLTAASLKLGKKEWYGPGRAASAWLSYISPSDTGTPGILLRETHETILEDWQWRVGQDTYYGGRFEQGIHGHVGDVWEYDINSAYPAIIATLPCLLHGHWSQGSMGQLHGLADSGQDGASSFTAVYGTAYGSNQFLGALPHRTRTGSIAFPHVTRGWYWKHEVDAGIRAGLIDRFNVEEWVSYDPCPCPPPVRAIRSLYLARIDPDVGKNSPRGRAYKLVYNSTYGKFAQSIGNPRFGNGIYASLITSGCRTQILNAIATHPHRAAAVTMIATDGVYFTSPHPGLDLTPNKLGAWEKTHLTGMTQLMPGVYWTDKGRAAVRDGGKLKVKSRGISAQDLSGAMSTLDSAFHDFAGHPTGETWPTFEIPIAFTITTTKQAIHRNRFDLAGHVDHGNTGCVPCNRDNGLVRKINSAPIHKRDHHHPYKDGPHIRTPIRTLDTVDTVPYSKAFGYGMDDALPNGMEEWGIAQDATITDSLSWMFQ